MKTQFNVGDVSNEVAEEVSAEVPAEIVEEASISTRKPETIVKLNLRGSILKFLNDNFVKPKNNLDYENVDTFYEDFKLESSSEVEKTVFIDALRELGFCLRGGNVWYSWRLAERYRSYLSVEPEQTAITQEKNAEVVADNVLVKPDEVKVEKKPVKKVKKTEGCQKSVGLFLKKKYDNRERIYSKPKD